MQIPDTIKILFKMAITPVFYRMGIYDRLLDRIFDQDWPPALIFVYHHIGSDKGIGENDELLTEWEKGIQETVFAQQMQFLRDNMNPLPLHEMIQFLKNGKSLPPRAIAVTIDDCYLDTYLYGFPALSKYHVPATIFLPTGFIESKKIFWWSEISESLKRTKKESVDLNRYASLLCDDSFPYALRKINVESKRGKIDAIEILHDFGKFVHESNIPEFIQRLYDDLEVAKIEPEKNGVTMTWKQINEMSGSGIYFESHSHSHPIFVDLDLEVIRNELTQSKEIIEGQTKQKVHGFCFPYGYARHHNKASRTIVRELGFDFACVGEPGCVSRDSDPYALKRISMSNLPLSVNVRSICQVLQSLNK